LPQRHACRAVPKLIAPAEEPAECRAELLIVPAGLQKPAAAIGLLTTRRRRHHCCCTITIQDLVVGCSGQEP
jgi:hypothetical protein